MLQVVNLTKIYKTKGGVTVKALDNVSVTFPETGMVFLLGKSGSGKSTLLNVCGGLDAPTSGEIIVKGRSSKNFSQSDFDSYRNTFIGFIFQEYNILNEFSVEDNIALALELQGKSKDKKAIAQLLEDIDLTGYAKRKPNTLSGGQKQRIAIARALIKAPQIIMADEPTGALDSNTGKQVLDTLKKLSKTKLVIVVSHDREFAEEYGDRIIELKDGQILSDVSKTCEEQRAISENVTFIGNTISVKSGAKLSDKEFGEIRAFLKNIQGDVMIMGGEQEVQAFRTAAHITDNGQKEVFRDTDVNGIENKTYSAKESKFIRSRLPARHSFKIGVSGLKTKPIRLFFTILLCTVAFVLFGLASTMTFYDSAATFKQSFIDSNVQTVRALKDYRKRQITYYNGKVDYSWDNYYDAAFSTEEVSKFAEQFGGDAFGAIENYSIYLSTQNNSNYYLSDIDYVAALPEDNGLRRNIIGDYPASDDEIMLTTYTATALINSKVYDTEGNTLEFQKIGDLIGKTLNFGYKEYKIVGLLPVEDLPSKFDPIRENDSEVSGLLQAEFESALNDSYRMVAFLSDNALRELSKKTESDQKYDDYWGRPLLIATSKDENGNYIYPDYDNGYYSYISHYAGQVTYLDENTTALTDTQAVIRAQQFFTLVNNQLPVLHSNARYDYENTLSVWKTANEPTFNTWESSQFESGESDELYVRYPYFSDLLSAWEYHTEDSIPTENHPLYPLYQSWLNDVYSALEKVEEIDTIFEIIYALQDGYDPVGGGKLTQNRRAELTSILLSYLKEKDIKLTISMQLFNYEISQGFGMKREMEVAGVLDLYTQDTSRWEDVILLNDAVAAECWQEQKACFMSYTESQTNYTALESEIYSAVFLPYNHSKEATNTLYSMYTNRKVLDERDTRIRISCSLTDTIEMVDDLITSMSKIFLWAGVVMATFAALLLSNFISVSISYKKRDIGILRAVGARGTDVFKIFFSESFVITSICSLISVIGTVAICLVMNAELGAGLGVSIFNFGLPSFITLLGIATLTAVLATFLPVWLAARKKPVDSIRAL